MSVMFTLCPRWLLLAWKHFLISIKCRQIERPGPWLAPLCVYGIPLRLIFHLLFFKGVVPIDVSNNFQESPVTSRKLFILIGDKRTMEHYTPLGCGPYLTTFASHMAGAYAVSGENKSATLRGDIDASTVAY